MSNTSQWLAPRGLCQNGGVVSDKRKDCDRLTPFTIVESLHERYDRVISATFKRVCEPKILFDRDWTRKYFRSVISTGGGIFLK